MAVTAAPLGLSQVLALYRWRAALLPLGLAVGFALWGYLLPAQYRLQATVTLPMQLPEIAVTERMSGLSRLMSATAARNLDKANTARAMQGTAQLASRQTLAAFIFKHNLKPELLALERWPLGESPVWQAEHYDGQRWFTQEPTMTEAVDALLRRLSFEHLKRKNLLRIELVYPSPERGARLLTDLIAFADQRQQQAQSERLDARARRLTAALRDVPDAAVRQTLQDRLTVDNTSRSLGAAAGFFSLLPVVSAEIPLEPFLPRPVVMALVGLAVGGLASIWLCWLWALVRSRQQ